MSALYYAPKYKNNIINLLLENEMFRELLNPSAPVYEDLTVFDVLIGGSWIIDGVKYEEQGYVFDYIFVDDTTTDEKTFVLVEAFNGKVVNNMFIDFDLYIYICSNKKLVRLSSITTPSVEELTQSGYYATTIANRVDTLCDCVDRIINGNSNICGIGNVEPYPSNFVVPYVPNNKFYGKCLRYHITNYNDGGDACEN